MADQADVYVNNNLADTISAARYCLPGENKDLEVSITSGNDEMIHLVRTETYLIIEPPSGKYTSDCTFSVSNEELLAWETMDDHWKVEIKPNNLPPDTPTTANVEVSQVG
ncbi:MAG: hypothetical protein PVH61_20645 [Candidatus Aminicenantes bacterium]|jgi:hypothetical protein